jgi:YHS domain-containing protein
MRPRIPYVLIACLGAGLTALVGCTEQSAPEAPPTTEHTHAKAHSGHGSVINDEPTDGDMPAKTADDEEKTLYLSPGGAYTEADIKANGNVTASEKFKGLKAQHNLKPKSGDKICPITLTKANPKFTWVVDGQSYEFCCPPCVDEFVAQAKDPQTAPLIKKPDDYRKR